MTSVASNTSRTWPFRTKYETSSFPRRALSRTNLIASLGVRGKSSFTIVFIFAWRIIPFATFNGPTTMFPLTRRQLSTLTPNEYWIPFRLIATFVKDKGNFPFGKRGDCPSRVKSRSGRMPSRECIKPSGLAWLSSDNEQVFRSLTPRWKQRSHKSDMKYGFLSIQWPIIALWADRIWSLLCGKARVFRAKKHAVKGIVK